ncbi:MAG TPA: hypothetical protein VMO88_16945 [Acidimicrobiales bacterium]|nr:hypothetical protein [Acidimicrobiales bacterium]
MARLGQDIGVTQLESPSRKSSVLPRIDMYCALGVVLIVGGIAATLTRTTPDTFDSKVMGQVATNLVNHHSVRIHVQGFNQPYSFYGIGMSLFMIPGVLAAKVLRVGDVVGTMVTNAWVLALLSGVVYAWTRLRKYSAGVSVVVAVLIGIGGGLLNLASTGLAEIVLALCVATGLLGLSAIHQQRTWGPYVLGAAVGAGVVTRDDSALLIMPWLVIGAVVVAARERRKLVVIRAVLAGLPFLALWGTYNAVRYGVPWQFASGEDVIFNHSLLTGSYGLLLSPGQGLLFYVPLLVVSAPGLVLTWRHERALSIVAVGLVVSRIPFYAHYSIWWGGGSFGPRYLLPAMPTLAVGLAPVIHAFRRYPWWRKSVIVVIASLSCSVGFIGAAVYYAHNPVEVAIFQHARLGSFDSIVKYFGAPSTEAKDDHYEFDWGKFPITAEARQFVHRRYVGAAALARPSDKLRAGLGASCVLLGMLFVVLGARDPTGRPTRRIHSGRARPTPE